MTDWEARDKKITAGQIKGNIVTNAVHLATHNCNGTIGLKELKASADILLELHRYTETLDVLGATVKKSFTVEEHIENILNTKDNESLWAYRNEHLDALRSIKGEDAERVREVFVDTEQKLTK